jgi:arylsulfatase
MGDDTDRGIGGVVRMEGESNTTAKKPNIVFMLADNTGWGDLSCYGGRVQTPCLDKLAAEGIRFENFNAEAQCTPTRSALLTGRMPIRSGTQAVPKPGEPGHYGMSPWEYTMANLLSDAGYATALFGKWHLGNVPGRVPTDQGFDEWWGISETSDEAGYSAHELYPPEWPVPQVKEAVKGEPVKDVADFDLKIRPFMDEKITDKTMDFIRRNVASGKPFYVYVGFTNLHPPAMAHPDFEQYVASQNPIPANLRELDFRAGQILDLLDELGIADDTIVVWVSDNAASTLLQHPLGDNGIWRGTFGSGWEGSIRAPAMVRWPGRIPSGVVTDEILACYDWMPTLVAMIGESDRMPTDRPIDGIDMSAFMLGQAEKSGRETFIFFGSDGGLTAVKWKTIKVHFRYTRSAEMGAPYINAQFPQFFDLVSDPKEEFDLLQTIFCVGWMMKPTLTPVLMLQKSAEKYPHIKTGQDDFNGYD